MIFLKKLFNKPLVLALGLLAVASSSKSHAGTPGFYVEYTNMTPNELSDQASKQCSNLIMGWLNVALGNGRYVDEAKRRKRMKSKGDAADFMSWGAKEIPLDDGSYVVAADCRPNTQQLDVLLVGRKGSVTYRLRGVPLGAKRLNWLVDEVARQGDTMWWN